MVLAGDGFAFCFRLGFLSVYIQKKNRLFISLSKIQIVITFTASAFTSPPQKKKKKFCFVDFVTVYNPNYNNVRMVFAGGWFLKKGF